MNDDRSHSDSRRDPGDTTGRFDARDLVQLALAGAAVALYANHVGFWSWLAAPKSEIQLLWTLAQAAGALFASLALAVVFVLVCEWTWNFIRMCYEVLNGVLVLARQAVMNLREIGRTGVRSRDRGFRETQRYEICDTENPVFSLEQIHEMYRRYADKDAELDRADQRLLELPQFRDRTTQFEPTGSVRWAMYRVEELRLERSALYHAYLNQISCNLDVKLGRKSIEQARASRGGHGISPCSDEIWKQVEEWIELINSRGEEGGTDEMDPPGPPPDPA